MILRPMLGWLRYVLQDLPWRAQTHLSEYDCVFVTVYIHHHNKVSEPFYGDLPQDLEGRGHRILRFGKIAWNYRRDLENELPKDHTSFSHLISKIEGLGLIIKCFLSGQWDNQFIIKSFIGLSLKKIIISNPDIKLVYPFEGNIWEEACVENHQTAIGYQHNAINPKSDKRSKIKKLPCQIISTGTAASKTIIEKLNIPKDRITDGYSLRLNLDIAGACIKASINKCLVLLQGHKNEGQMLKIISDFKMAYPNYQITLRAHPAHPIAKDDYPNFDFSECNGLHEDIVSHDVCFYTGSSAAFESLALGIPVIHIECRIGDPLFECPSMHETAHTVETLYMALAKMKGQSDLANAQKYIKTYFRPYQKAHAKDFEKWLNL